MMNNSNCGEIAAYLPHISADWSTQSMTLLLSLQPSIEAYRSFTAPFWHNSQYLVDFPHRSTSPLHQALGRSSNPSLRFLYTWSPCLLQTLAQHLASFSNPHTLQPSSLLHGSMHLNTGTRIECGVCQSRKVHICTDINEARGREGRGKLVSAYAA